MKKQLLTASAALLAAFTTSCGENKEITRALAVTPEVYKECNQLALEVLFASYEQAGGNQGRLKGFALTERMRQKNPKLIEEEVAEYILLPSKRIETRRTTRTYPPMGTFNPSYMQTDSRLTSKTDLAITCEIRYEGEGSAPRLADYTISKDSGKLYWSMKQAY